MIVCSQRNLKNKHNMENDRAQLVDRLKQSTNVLITVNNNPSVDQLAACIGVTLLLNKMGKHATAVFSGQVPSTIEFLKPEETLEKNTDSLRDFIIALDKAKADKLRYKVEDTMVKIFITPYKTSITDKDLEFSQGDFNIDVILALGIHDREQIDQAIMAHGRILHDAVIMTADCQTGSNLGTVNWVEEQASSLCEMLASITDDLQSDALDGQIATALLTGIVAETDRFSNEKTTSSTMGVSSKLMAAGADQHLVATELEPKPEPPAPVVPAAAPIAETPQPEAEQPPQNDDGAIVIDHEEVKPQAPELPPVDPNEINIDDEGTMKRTTELVEEQAKQAADAEAASQQQAEADQATQAETEGENPADKTILTQSPALGGTFTASGRDPLEPTSDPLSTTAQSQQPILNKSEEPPVTTDTTVADILSNKSAELPEPTQTLEQIEEAVHQEEAAESTTPPSDIESAREAVNSVINDAVAAGTMRPEPPMAMGSQPVNLDMGHPAEEPSLPVPEPTASLAPAPDPDQPAVNPSTGEPQYPVNLVPPNNDLPAENTSSSVDSPVAPPPVPPPMMPPAMPPVDSSTTGSSN